MPDFNFNFDRISFWLGFIAASLLWWVFSRVRPMFPEWREQVRQTINLLSQRNLSGVEEYLRRETLRRAQRQHLAAPLFSLDEILIQPWLLVPPSGQDPADAPPNHSIAGQVIPYLPDWPELVAPFGVPVLKPIQAIQSGRNLAIIGQPGSGKTVALAHLAAQIARKDPEAGKYVSAVPVFLHALELDPVVIEDQDPLANLIRVIAGNASVVMQPQIPRFLQSVFADKQRKVVLLLDGLDELTQDQLTAVLVYLNAFCKKHPRLQIIMTASSEYLDGMTKAGIYPLALAAWSQSERMAFAQQWGQLWSKELAPEMKKQGGPSTIDPLILENWLTGETAYTSPLEWTLRLWGAYAGDLSGSAGEGILTAGLARFLPDPAYLPALAELAHRMALKPTASLGFEDAEEILTSTAAAQAAVVPLVDTTDPAVETAQSAETEPQPGKEKKNLKKSRRESMDSPGEQIIDALVSGGILVEYANRQIRFTSPVFLAFLAGMKLTGEEAAEAARSLKESITWPVTPALLHYAAACGESTAWIDPLIEEADTPLFSSLLMAARWLKDTPPAAEWRQRFMRALVTQIQNELLPIGSRARLIAAVYLSRDPSTVKLFKQLLVSKSAVIRRVALLGCGALGNPQLINDILALLADREAEVRHTACLSLATLQSEAALNALVEILLSGDEDLRQAAAEALALNKTEGYKVLEEAATVDDLLTRRAAVFGLMQIHEPWARKVLEKIAVEDGQWVVRNAAAQALDTLQQTAPALPKPLPRPSDAGWLLAFAGKLGMGILPGQPATDVLMAVLKSGSVEEQIAALHYLRDQADEGIIGSIYDMLYSGEEKLSEPVLHALWWIAASGKKLPSPTQFGLG